MISCFLIFLFVPSGNTNVLRHHYSARNNALIIAIKSYKIYTVRDLLHRGASPNARQPPIEHRKSEEQLSSDFRFSERRSDRQSTSALLLALGCWASDDPHATEPHPIDRNIVQALVTAGANVNEHEPDLGVTPLMLAAKAGEITLCAVLIQHGARIEKKDKIGSTALMYAVLSPQQDHTNVVQLLLRKGANPNAMSRAGDRPLCLVRGPGRLNYINLLVKYGANINARDKRGKTILSRIITEQSSLLGAPNDVIEALRKLHAR